jgi:hypothetical protein
MLAEVGAGRVFLANLDAVSVSRPANARFALPNAGTISKPICNSVGGWSVGSIFTQPLVLERTGFAVRSDSNKGQAASQEISNP